MSLHNYSVLVTGADGFVGKNLVLRLFETSQYQVIKFVRGNELFELTEMVLAADAVIHLAAENRPKSDFAYEEVNVGLTKLICETVKEKFSKTNRHTPIIFASSTQAELDNPYGRSKLSAEKHLRALSKSTGNPCIVYRFPGIFGKWCKPNYNSVVSTFCYNLARNIPIKINDPHTTVSLAYIDDVLEGILNSLVNFNPGFSKAKVRPVYTVTLEKLAAQIRCFSKSRNNLIIGSVGSGFDRALYATYISFLPKNQFVYSVPSNKDHRGAFVEMLKTPNCGQFSYFTANPGLTRGSHYHHTKTEKFLVINGNALFRFRNILTNEIVEARTSGKTPEIVDTIPGWAHEITNVGDDELFVLLWANENFDLQKPDTFQCSV